MRLRSLLAGLALLILVAGGLVAARRVLGQISDAGVAPGFRLVRDVPLTGKASRFDYQSLDPQSHRLYIAHMGDGMVTVFNTQADAVLADIPGLSSVHGVIAVPTLGRVYATATGKNQIAVVDDQTLAVLAMVPAGDYPDGLAYDPDVSKVYVSDEHGKTDTVIDAQTNQVVATIPLGGGAGNTQFDPASRLIYVAVHDVNQLIAIDPATDQIAGRYDMPGCDDPHGLSIVPERRVAFVACEGNATLLAVDMQSWQVIGTQPVGKAPDVLAFDPALGVLYVAAESGQLTVVALDDSGIRIIAQGDVGSNGHSVAVDPDTHHAYLPLQNVGGHPVLREIALDPSNGG